MGETIEIRVPDIGDFKDVPVIEVLVHPGDRVKKEDPLIALESEKATMEVPSPSEGVIGSVAVKIGDKVSQGSLIVTLASGGAPGSAAVPALAPEPAPPRAESAPAAPAAPAGSNGHVHASPGIRRLAREFGVGLERVRGSGPHGRITKEDVQAYVKSALAGAAVVPGGGPFAGIAPWPKIDFAQYGPIETVPLSRIKRIAGAALHRNWLTIPHVTNHDDADVTELEAFRLQLNAENAKAGLKVTMLAFLIKAAVAALRKYPDFNASLEGENLVLKRYYNVGFAADTPNGLVVPVVKNADAKGIYEIAGETAGLAEKARNGQLAPADMAGGTFTISSLGGIGGTSFTPIVNAPEVAILGVSRAAMRPVWNGSEFKPRLILPLSLSWDHRVLDGAAAARFNACVAAVLADLRRTLL